MEYEHMVMHLNPLPTLLKFDRQLPVYNWLYPFESEDKKIAEPFSVFTRVEPRARRRAIYIHVPFCDTICSFCPFTRGEYQSGDELDRYMQALLKEFEIKHAYDAIKSQPVDCIYIGGGSPSVLRTEHFYQLGEALHRYFDLSQLQEFTMECEVKSVTLEKLKAWKDIGVNRTSFGVQTFNPLYRELFNITSTVEQVRQVSGWVNELFPSTNVDMIHAMPGQSLDELLQDVEAVNELGMTTVDYYTLNNVVAQPRMHRAFAEKKLQPLSANTKLSYRIFLNEYLRAQGYIPNNSYSFTRSKAAPGAPRAVIQRDPVFLYQEITYGFTDDYVDAYGPGAHSHFGEFLINNIANREQYAARLLSEKPRPWFVACSDLDVSSKGIVYFPYRGFLEKSSVEWDKVEAEVRASLDDIVKCGLAVEHSDHYELTEVGWLFAVNLMYMLMPKRDQAIFSEFIARQNASPDRKPDDVIFMPRKRSVVPAISAD